MKKLSPLVCGLILVALTAGIWAGEPSTRKLLIGAWEVTKADKGAPLAVGDVMDFAGGGKYKTIHKKDRGRGK